MMDYIGAAALFVFIVLVLTWLWRRERRDRLTAEGKLATENQRAAGEELTAREERAGDHEHQEM
jgi:membrane protein implicated in regulation of membrane protease activity